MSRIAPVERAPIGGGNPDITLSQLRKQLRLARYELSRASDTIKQRLTEPIGAEVDITTWALLATSARMFHIRDYQDASAMVNSYPDGSDPFLVAPFPVFCIVLDQAPYYRLPESLAKEDGSATSFEAIKPNAFMVDSTALPWRIWERTKVRIAYFPDADKGFEPIRDQVSGRYTPYAFSGYPCGIDPSDGRITGAVADLQRLETLECEDGSTQGAALTGPSLVRALCAFANHVDVSAIQMVDPDRPPNRQQRRAQGYKEQEHYRIVIRGRIERIGREIAQEKGLRQRREHEVRSHLRYLASGRVSKVRSHKRCRGKGEFIRRDYQANPTAVASA